MPRTLEVPEELARRLGPEAARMAREASGRVIPRHGTWAEVEFVRFLGLGRLALDRILKDHGVELSYNWDDWDRQRKMQWEVSGF